MAGTYGIRRISQMGPVAVVGRFIRNPDAPHYSSLVITPKRPLPPFLINNRKTMEMRVRRLAKPD